MTHPPRTAETNAPKSYGHATPAPRNAKRLRPVASAPMAALLILVGQAATLAASEPATQPFPLDTYAKQVVPLVKKYCGGCHGATRQEAGISLLRHPDVAAVKKDHETWTKAHAALTAGEMPPDDQPQPTADERRLLQNWITSTLNLDGRQPSDPGRVTLRRLNRAEYDNTIRDLTGLDLRLAKDFPSDDVGEGFDNIGDVLSLPPLLLEKYLNAAEVIVQTAMLPEHRRRIVIAVPGEGKSSQQAAREVLQRFGTRAFRRPIAADELDRLVKLVESALQKGDSFERGLQVAVTAVLVSPHFLYRVELDPSPDDPQQKHAVNDYELATRLSYFLWSSMPDDELFQLAAAGKLHQTEVLQQQTRRMLKDKKADALVEDFAGQWLNLRNLQTAAPDPQLFGAFTEELRHAMLRETELFAAAILREDRSILDFLSGDFTYVNQRLAEYYGLPDVRGEAFQRVRLADGKRGGVLTQASVLTLTSNPTRTSPVKRGKWILENVLGTPPPPPPPNVPTLEETQKDAPGASLREQLEAHRRNPVCASCHREMDELGFALENFDAIGRWRERDGKTPINAAAALPSGEKFTGPRELAGVLSQRKAQFSRTLTRKLLTYALGRGLAYYDRAVVERIAQDLETQDYRFSALVWGIVNSEPFRLRRGDGGA
jgi:mono/diheme cytochrome c family protein